MENVEEIIYIKSKLEQQGEDIKEMKEEIKNHNAFSTQIALLNKTVGDLNNAVSEMRKSIDILNNKPVQTFDSIKACVITGIITAIISFIAARIL